MVTFNNKHYCFHLRNPLPPRVVLCYVGGHQFKPFGKELFKLEEAMVYSLNAQDTRSLFATTWSLNSCVSRGLSNRSKYNFIFFCNRIVQWFSSICNAVVRRINELAMNASCLHVTWIGALDLKTAKGLCSRAHFHKPYTWRCGNS
jgi:hypothetical protein